MDKKNLTIGVLLLVAAFTSLFVSSRLAPPAPPAPEIGDTSAPNPLAANQAPTTAPFATSPHDATFAAITTDQTEAVVSTLANDHIEVHLTNFGGAVSNVALKQYPAVLGEDAPYVFNQLHADPILAFTDFPGLDRNTPFTLVSATATEVVYRAIFENRIEVTRRYALPGPDADPYRIRHETTFRNLTELTAPLPAAAVSLGTASLTSSNDPGVYLNVVSYDNDDATYIDRGELEGGGLLAAVGVKDGAPKAVVEKPSAIAWAAVKNQFFASIYTPDQPGTGIIARRIELPPFPGTTRPNIGLTGATRLALPSLAPGASATVGGLLYVGPKEYTRLAKFDHREDKVMQFDRYFFNRIFFSGIIAPFMNMLMNWTHSLVGNWGLAIVLMTLLLKVATLPFTLAASRSAKRMQKLQPEMKAVREKFKDNPQKMNQATMELFKKHKVNPAGGCLPILITIPLFIAFFAMLQGTAELRFQSFLWAHDLSAPDTVLRIFGIPLNIMPLLMGATMIWQMQITPQPGIDSTQAKLFKFMPIIFTLICYNFAAALALYSTINGMFTIGQQLIVNRMKEPEPAEAALATPAGRKPIKNVTPKKKG